MLHNWKKYFTRLQVFSILLSIFFAPNNLFLKLLPNTGYVHGLQIDYLIPKLFLTDLLMLSSILLEILKNFHQIKHTMLKACTQFINNSQLTTHNSQQQKQSYLPLTFSFYLLACTFFFSHQLFTPFPILAFWQMFRITLFIVFFFLVKNTKAVSKNMLIKTFFASIFFQVVFGFGQFLSQHSLTPYRLLGETQLHNQPYLARADFSWLDIFIGTNFGLRVLPYGLTPHPNVLAGFLVLGIVVLTSKYQTQQRSKTATKKVHNLPQKTPNKSKTQKLKSFIDTFTFYLLFIIFFIALFLTQSLSAWIALVLFTLFYHFFQRHNLQLKKLMPKHLNSYILLSIGFLLLFLLTPLILTYFKKLNFQTPGMDKLSLSRRVELNDSAWKMFSQNLVFGVGFNQFSAFVEEYSDSKEVVSFAQPAHHVGLLFLAENGIIGASLLLLLSLWANKKLTTNNSHFTAFNTFLPPAFCLLPILSLDHYVYSLNQGWWMIFIIAFLISKPSPSITT